MSDDLKAQLRHSLFCRRMRELRYKHGLEQTEVGEVIKKHHATVSRLERGRRKPDIDTVCRLADLFGVSADYLLGRSET